MKSLFVTVVMLSFLNNNFAETKQEVIKKLEIRYKKDRARALKQYQKSVASIKNDKKDELQSAMLNKEESEKSYHEAMARYKKIKKDIAAEIETQVKSHKLIYEEELKFLEESFYTKIKRYDPGRRRAKKRKKAP